MVEAVNKILSEYNFPLTIRQIHYRLVSSGFYPNTRSSYNGLSKTLVKAREDGEVDDTRIEDRARQVIEAPEGYAPDEYVTAVSDWFKTIGGEYQADLWANQPGFVEVWVEKDALSSLINQVVEPYRVTVCPCRGYSSYTYIKRTAIDGRLRHVTKPIIILYLGDHDPSGLQMTEDLESRLVKYGHGLNIAVKRVALTYDQVKEYNLIPNPTKKADTRSQAYVSRYGDECWELDAVEPNELQRLVRSTIEELINQEAWEAGLVQEAKDRTRLKERFSKIKI